MQRRSEWYVPRKEVGNNLLELEHELEALTARQNALLDQALANMEDLTIAEQLKTLLEEKQHLQTRIDAAKKEAANRINEDSRMAELRSLPGGTPQWLSYTMMTRIVRQDG